MSKQKPNYKFLFYVTQNYSFAVLRPLQLEIKRQGYEVKWFLTGQQVNYDYLHDSELQLHTIREVFKYKPDAVFVPGNRMPTFIPGIKVAVFHGFNVSKRPDEIGHFNIRGCFDLYCTQGPNTTTKFQQLADKHQFFNVVETGWPMLDPLFSKDQKTVVNTNAKKTILFCSTFSKNLTCAPSLLNEIQRLKEKHDWQWIVQFHPKMSKTIVDSYKRIHDDKLTFVETDNIIPLLQQADIMLCDTSSVLLSFILQNKPVVTFKNQRPDKHLLNFTNVNELEDNLKSAFARPTELLTEIERFNAQLHPYQDGKSSARVLSAAIKIINQNPCKKRKPFNLIRLMKTAWKLKFQL
ncbi:CDP-glycerol--glycerophosphate glycerophosphotransferase [Thalassotalea sp. 42_200_T64]|nr:CDP-glycerol--glycerophosphate glycerophosphotransferase [Thalassotalea sp. 42_200_T64]